MFTQNQKIIFKNLPVKALGETVLIEIGSFTPDFTNTVILDLLQFPVILMVFWHI